MRNLSLKTVCNEIWLKRNIVMFMLIVCVLIGGLYGYNKGKNHELTVREREAAEAYASELANYEEAIRNATEGLALAEKSRSNIENYMENSLYMKLDPENVYFASVQYVIEPVVALEETGGNKSPATISDVLQTYIQFINDGNFRIRLIEEYNSSNQGSPLSKDVIKELVQSGAVNNILYIKVLCLDETMALAMKDAIISVVDAQKSQVESVQGPYNISILSDDVYATANIDVRYYQNGRNDELKNSNIAVNDQLSRQTDAIHDRDMFVEDNEIEIQIDDPKKEAIKWVLFGFVTGIVAVFTVFLLRYIISGRIDSADEILYGGLAVAGTFKKNEKVRNDVINQDINGMILMASKYNLKNLFVWSLVESEEFLVVSNAYNEVLKNVEGSDVCINALNTNDSLSESMKEMADAGACMIAVKLHKTTYEQLEKQRQLLKSLNINVLGCLIVE